MANGKFCVLVKGFSPNYSNSDTLNAFKVIFDISDGSTSNRYVCYYHYTSKVFYLSENIDNISKSVSINCNFNKFQTINMLAVKTSTNLQLYILPNNGTLLKTSVVSNNFLEGSYSLRIGSNLNGGEQMDAFVDKVMLFDLDKLNSPNGFTDAEADALLRGNVVTYDTDRILQVKNDELFDKTKVVLHSNASWDGDTLVLNATGGYQGSYIDVSVLPNNRYEILWKETHSINSSYLQVDEYYNSNIMIKQSSASGSNGATLTFTTNKNTNKIRLWINNTSVAGVFTFSDISLKLKM